MNRRERAGYQDCLELFVNTIEQLNNSLQHIEYRPILNAELIEIQTDNVQTWLSAALTNQDICSDGFDKLRESNIKSLMQSNSQSVSKFISNSLSVFKQSTMEYTADHFNSSPFPTRRRRLFSDKNETTTDIENDDSSDGFPEWISAEDRRLLLGSHSRIKAHVIVAKDGSGDFTSITDAVNASPLNSKRRHIIRIRAGIYREYVRIPSEMSKVMLVGEGRERTFLVGNRSVKDGWSTIQSATFAAYGSRFIVRDITFQNTAGPRKEQAVALSIGSDKAVIYRCNIRGYQDTLYAQAFRQFYRECDIYGTIDFIFGNAAAVLQNCNIYARKPLFGQIVTITAQGRNDPNQNTGFSIHSCRIRAAPDLLPVIRNFEVYLGRPWKQYSRTVIMLSRLDNIIHPAGWLDWSGDFALATLYYAEYMNRGPATNPHPTQNNQYNQNN